MSRENPFQPASLKKTLVEVVDEAKRSQRIRKYDPDERPEPPVNLTKTFRVRESKTHLTYELKASCDPLTPNTCQADIDLYIFQMRYTDASGDPKEGTDKETVKVPAKEVFDSESVNPHAIFHLKHPRSWYVQMRARIADKDHRKSEWTAWDTQVLPCDAETLPKPPIPDNITLSYDHKGKGKHSRLRALTTLDEVVNWDIPGGDGEPDMKEYAAQLDFSEDGVSWNGPPYRTRKVEAKDDPADTTRTIVFASHIFKRYYYRTRARSIDRFNRRGDWSDWVGDTLPVDNDPPAHPENVTIFDSATDRVVLDWDDPVVYLPTHGTVDAVATETTLAGTDTLFTVEVGEGTVIKVGAEVKTVTDVTSDTVLEVDSAWSNNHDDVVLKVEHPDPDAVRSEYQISKSPTFATIYRKDICGGTKRSIKVADADKGDTFYGRVRSLDSSENRSAFIPATLTGNSDPDVSPDGVVIGKGGKTKYPFRYSGFLDLLTEADSPDLELDEALSLKKVRARVKQAPTGADIVIGLYKNNVSIGTVTILDGEKRGHKDDWTDTFADEDVISNSIDQIGSTTPGKNLTVVWVFE